MRSVSTIPNDACESATDTLRRGARQCFGAGSMVALLLVLTVLPAAAAFAAPEAVGQISILLHEAVRPRPDREPREPRIVEAQREVCATFCQVSVIRGSDPTVQSGEALPGVLARPCLHEVRCEAFAALPWLMDTPPPAC